MNPSDEASKSLESSLLDTSSFDFHTSIFDDTISDGGHHDPFDALQDDDGDAETKYLPMQRQLDRMFGMGDDSDDGDDLPIISSRSTSARHTSDGSSSVTRVSDNSVNDGASTSSQPPSAQPTTSALTTHAMVNVAPAPVASHSDSSRSHRRHDGRSRPTGPNEHRRSIYDVFPWLTKVDRLSQECMGSIVQLKPHTVLDAMDFFIR